MKSLPAWAERLLRAICPEELYEEIEGDLIEIYHHDVRTVGKRRAKLRFIPACLRFFRPGIILRNRFDLQQNHLPMFRNYFVTSLRHIRKGKVNFAFKLGGLTLAIFSFISIALYVSYQTSYDTQHVDHQNIYRVNSQRKEEGQLTKYAIVPLAIGPMLKQNIPEIQSFARTRYANGSYLRYEGKGVSCGGLLEADSTLFDILKYDFIEGTSNALRIPNGIVLTQPIAKNLFGAEKALGKLITINNEKKVYQVSGVIADPIHTCFGFEAVILNQSELPLTMSSIVSPVEFLDESATLFVRLGKPITDDLHLKVESVLERFINKQNRQETGFSLSFQPVASIFLDPEYKGEFAMKGSSIYVYAFSVLGVLLLLVAGINYVNLSIADFSSRARETGVRKVLGARKTQLITQVTIETLLFGLIALVISLGVLYLFFPKINELLDRDLRFEMLTDPAVLTISTVGLMGLLFLSSWFPARIFAASGAIQNLKSKNSGYNSSLSQVLLFVQFSISAICIGCAVMVGKQISFIHNKDLGFNKENLLMLNMPSEFTVKNMKTFKHELKQVPGVTHVTNSSFMLSGGYWKDWYYVEQEDKPEMKQIELFEVFSDDELFSTLGIKLLQGRTFNANIPSDSGAAYIVNESAVRELGWKEPLGKRIYTHPEEKGKWDGTVVGVVSDINISPLYDKVKPLVMRLPWTNEYPDGFIYVRYTGDTEAVIQLLEEKYKAIMPGYPLNWFHVDDLYDRRHEKENKAYTSLQFGTGIIVLISVLGIFSMAMYMSVKRMKEFGIRKVLGASVAQISMLHMNYFVRLALFACAVALPVTFMLIGEWLNTFAYKIELDYIPFLLVVFATLVVVMLSVSYSALKSGRMNPIDVIKME